MLNWFDKEVIKTVGTLLLADKSSAEIANELSRAHKTEVTKNMIISHLRSEPFFRELVLEFGPPQTKKMMELWSSRGRSGKNRASAGPMPKMQKPKPLPVPKPPRIKKVKEPKPPSNKRRGRPPGSKNKGPSKARSPNRVNAAALLPPKAEFKQPREEAEPVVVVAFKEDTVTAVLELRGHQCKWPLGDPMNPNFAFCGKAALADGPYCDDHDCDAHGRPRGTKRAAA